MKIRYLGTAAYEAFPLLGVNAACAGNPSARAEGRCARARRRSWMRSF